MGTIFVSVACQENFEMTLTFCDVFWSSWIVSGMLGVKPFIAKTARKASKCGHRLVWFFICGVLDREHTLRYVRSQAVGPDAQH